MPQRPLTLADILRVSDPMLDEGPVRHLTPEEAAAAQAAPASQYADIPRGPFAMGPRGPFLNLGNLPGRPGWVPPQYPTPGFTNDEDMLPSAADAYGKTVQPRLAPIPVPDPNQDMPFGVPWDAYVRAHPEMMGPLRGDPFHPDAIFDDEIRDPEGLLRDRLRGRAIRRQGT